MMISKRTRRRSRNRYTRKDHRVANSPISWFNGVGFGGCLPGIVYRS